MGDLSQHFSLSEFSVSGSFPHLVKPVPPEYRPNVQELVTTILEPIRQRWDSKIRVTSGYRDPILNKAVSGSPTSQHLVGQAADFTTEDLPGLFKSLIFSKIIQHGQCILYPDRNFMHIAVQSGSYRRPIFQIHAPRFGLRYQYVLNPNAATILLRKVKI